MKCPYCAEKIKKEAQICRFCGKSLKVAVESAIGSGETVSFAQTTLTSDGNNQSVNGNRPEIAESYSNRRRIAVLAITAILLGGIGVGGFQYNSKLQEERRIEAARVAKAKAAAEAARKLREAEAAERAEYLRALEDDSWLPKGFTKFALNPYLAYRKDNSQSCTLDKCFPFELVSAKYCSSVYVEGNSGRNGVVYDWSNDTAQGVSPGTRVKMKLEYSHNASSTSTTFTEVSCR